ncbi:MAG: diguanylate cyclase domain-containing protein [Mycobacterium sp.]
MTAPNWQDPRHPDHYHWMTSRLDARGARVATSRFIAVWMIVGGLAPVLIIFGATNSAQWSLRAAAAGISLASGLLGLLWVRGLWPTKRQSAGCVVIATLLGVATCLLMPHPLLGLMGTAVFSAVATYATMFHTRRFVGLVLVAAATVIVITGTRLGANDPAMALGLSLTIALSIIFTTFVVRALIGLIDADMFAGAIEPITGLLSREGFDDGVAITISARGRTDDRYLVIVVVDLDSFSAVADIAGAGRARQLRVLVAQMLREKARRDTVIAHTADSEFVLADVFNTSDPDPLCARINAGVPTAAPELTASVGAVVTPLTPLAALPPNELTDTLLRIAGEAMATARSSGGNQHRIVYLPELPGIKH